MTPKTKKHTIRWWVTVWAVAPSGREWEQQPVILIADSKQKPFYAAHPSNYITKLEEMHENDKLTQGPFNRVIGEFKDALDQGKWEALE